MRALVVYESMFGNTHRIAEAIGAGFPDGSLVEVVSVHDAPERLPDDLDVLVVGGPTHVHGMSRPSTREAAEQQATDRGLTMDPDAAGDGIREWLEDLTAPVPAGVRGAAFDTRASGPPVLTGRASKGIAKHLRHHGVEVVADPESFLVTRETELAPDELDHARAWGARIADAVR